MISLNIEVMRTVVGRSKTLNVDYPGLENPSDEFDVILQNHVFLQHNVDGLLCRANHLTTQVSHSSPYISLVR